MKIDPNAPAYPVDPGCVDLDTNPNGLTIRAEFAARAMAAWRASESGVEFGNRNDSHQLARLALEDADALIDALNKEKA